MQKLLIVYNPHSSHHAAIEREVLAPARQLTGWMVGKYAVRPTSFADNVKNVGKLLSDGDFLIVAGGDGTATMAMNSALNSGKAVTVGVIGYGNLNDTASMLRTTRLQIMNSNGLASMTDKFCAGEVRKLYPLAIKINEQHWRYAPCYMSVGLLAEATTVMEEPKVRQKLTTSRESTWFSLRTAVRWYLKHHKQEFLPAGSLNGAEFSSSATDYLAINGSTVAKIMKGGDWWQNAEVFGSTVESLGKFWKMVSFGLKSVRKGIPLQESQRDILQFAKPSSIVVQTEGEYERLENVSEIEIEKAKQSLMVISME